MRMPIHDALGLPEGPDHFRRDKPLQRDGTQVDAGQPVLPMHGSADLWIELTRKYATGAVVTEKRDLAQLAEPLRFVESVKSVEIVAVPLQKCVLAD